MVTEEQLAAWESLAEAATPPPWKFPDTVDGITVITPQRQGIATVADDGNARFIAAARTAVPELIAEVRRLRRQIEGHCERIAKQSDQLSLNAERWHLIDPSNR